MKSNLNEEKKYFERLISLNPQFYSAYLNLAWINRLESDFENAIVNYEKAAEIEKNYKVLFELGECYEQLSDFNRALKNYSASIDLNPELIDEQKEIKFKAYLNLARLYKKINNNDEVLTINKIIKNKFPEFNVNYYE